MTNYYDINLKKDRHSILEKNSKFIAYKGLLGDIKLLQKICEQHKPKIVIHLAAQAGVRYSIENPESYVESNLVGTFNILEMARKFKPKHLLIASTSSIYGNSNKVPFNENQMCDHPISFYASTKKSNEVIAHSYSHLYEIPITVFRFFTVYGPWGRPDMALFKFTKNIFLGKPIDIYNYGEMTRDFTNIDDLVMAIKLLTDIIPLKPEKRKKNILNDSISQSAPYRIVNIGSSNPLNLMDYVFAIEKALGMVAKKNFLKMQAGDVKATFSNTDLLYELTNFRPQKKIDEGVSEFVDWYISYYKK